MPAPAELRAFTDAMDDLDDVYTARLSFDDVYGAKVFSDHDSWELFEGRVILREGRYVWERRGGPDLPGWSASPDDPAAAASDLIDTINAAKTSA